jgi:hypothetical protein
VFWVISVYFNIRNTLPKYGTFLLGHPVYESVDRDIFDDIKITLLTHGAVAQHPNLPGMKSRGLPYKLQTYATKREALDDPKMSDEIRSQWYAVERNEDVELPDVACYARAQICIRKKNKLSIHYLFI